MTKFFKSKKTGKPLPAQEPREIAVIQEESNNLLTQLAKNTYTGYVLERQNQMINERLLAVNQEGDARQKLDAAKNAPKEEAVQ